jgi:pimeloyl-ACP methyl ester carboxylesterase
MKLKMIVAGIVLIGILLILDSCMQFRVSQTEINKRFSETGVTGSQATYKAGARKIHYAKAGNENGPLILFVHGSPGSLNDFMGMLTDTALQKTNLLISVDRPGFGQSDFGWGEPSLAKQSVLLKPLIEQYKNDRPVILVGHSLGGPLIARMAMDYPGLVDGLIFVAASVDPNLEPANWWRAPFATPFFRWMMPRSIRASNDEIYPLKLQLTEMLSRWKEIQSPVIVVHGTKDSLVPFANAAFIQTQLKKTTAKMIIEEGMDHFVPWSHPHLIRGAVAEMIKNVGGRPLASSP